MVRREEEGDSTETEDSDDSDVEQPVPPPRRKKNQQQRKAPPPRPPPPQIRIKKQVQELPNEQSQVTNSDSAKDASATSVSVISVSVISASTTSASLISAPADQETTEVDVTAAKSRDEDFNEEQQQVSSEVSLLEARDRGCIVLYSGGPSWLVGCEIIGTKRCLAQDVNKL